MCLAGPPREKRPTRFALQNRTWRWPWQQRRWWLNRDVAISVGSCLPKIYRGDLVPSSLALRVFWFCLCCLGKVKTKGKRQRHKLHKVKSKDSRKTMFANWISSWSLLGAFHLYISELAFEIPQSSIQYAGLLGWWDKRFIDQMSDVPSIIFFTCNFL